jgi:serine phosphatase RsbU (regulator of sigma subunit)
VTAAAAAIAPATGELEVLVAGHPPPLVCDARGMCRSLDRLQNPPLGLASSSLRTSHTRLAPGDLLALYSDGVVEVRDPRGRMLGTHALAHTLSSLVRLHGAARVGARASPHDRGLRWARRPPRRSLLPARRTAMSGPLHPRMPSW